MVEYKDLHIIRPKKIENPTKEILKNNFRIRRLNNNLTIRR